MLYSKNRPLAVPQLARVPLIRFNMNWVSDSHDWFADQLSCQEFEGALAINDTLVPIMLTPVASGSSIDGEIELKGNNKAFTIRTEQYDPKDLRQNMIIHFPDRKWKIVKDNVKGADRFLYWNDPLQKTYTVVTCEAPS